MLDIDLDSTAIHTEFKGSATKAAGCWALYLVVAISALAEEKTLQLICCMSYLSKLIIISNRGRHSI